MQFANRLYDGVCASVVITPIVQVFKQTPILDIDQGIRNLHQVFPIERKQMSNPITKIIPNIRHKPCSMEERPTAFGPQFCPLKAKWHREIILKLWQ